MSNEITRNRGYVDAMMGHSAKRAQWEHKWFSGSCPCSPRGSWYWLGKDLRCWLPM